MRRKNDKVHERGMQKERVLICKSTALCLTHSDSNCCDSRWLQSKHALSLFFHWRQVCNIDKSTSETSIGKEIALEVYNHLARDFTLHYITLHYNDSALDEILSINYMQTGKSSSFGKQTHCLTKTARTTRQDCSGRDVCPHRW